MMGNASCGSVREMVAAEKLDRGYPEAS